MTQMTTHAQRDALADFLLAYRERHGLSQLDVQRRTGIAHEVICRWERGRNAPSLVNLRRLARHGALSEGELRDLVAAVFGGEAVRRIAIDDAGAEPWGVYVESCATCGGAVRVVATVASVDNGTADWYADPRCSACKGSTP